jgi:hypothetical protein
VEIGFLFTYLPSENHITEWSDLEEAP